MFKLHTTDVMFIMYYSLVVSIEQSENFLNLDNFLAKLL